MFLFLVSLYGEFKPEYFSERYRMHFNLDSMKFKCFNENKEISIDDIDDGICNCCDGSDEVSNTSFSCPNTCPIHVKNSEANELKGIFNKGIVNRVVLGAQGQQLYHELSELNKIQTQKRDELSATLKEARAQLKKQKKDIKKWVYESNGLPMPDKAKLAAEREKYINRVEKVAYRQDAAEEEEGEGFEVPQIDQEAFKKRKQHRALKWDYAQKEKYINLLNTAIDKTKITESSGNVFLAKLRVAETVKYHPTYQAYLDTQKIVHDTSDELSKIGNSVYMNNLRLEIDYGADKQWYQSYGKTLTAPIANTPNKVSISLLQRASVRLPSTGCSRSNDYGAYIKRINNILVYQAEHVDVFKGQRSMRVKCLCHPEYVVLEAHENTDNRAEAVIGLPEVCPAQYSDNEFTQWLREIQYYKSDLLKGTEFEYL
ncbi:hypothetical protein TVAG_027820 [Trichomonas vaginalis G3]|uniref:Glucosidase 2 subunit beta n=1 Tax=Trichomonas vaginalis (strain ATCC PRA-98 / G3) TaxID=412133 RepID=A2E521_TRIV3|nr:N-linked oligosaccharide processing family [Trichomonas vaginalis G3]EAY12229.1 hypothetical protein TVAG_027820 [Trichomonas vaginalis G3]KAI5536015.1 N-linked oligosaccharide processing family [Trichomonas vaginalis G3]|eukprot:XP_001324452.1 hypothetical protein [Trichomonas vaginalis G3]